MVIKEKVSMTRAISEEEKAKESVEGVDPQGTPSEKVSININKTTIGMLGEMAITIVITTIGPATATTMDTLATLLCYLRGRKAIKTIMHRMLNKSRTGTTHSSIQTEENQ